jgi:hypothetical protein
LGELIAGQRLHVVHESFTLGKDDLPNIWEKGVLASSFIDPPQRPDRGSLLWGHGINGKKPLE